MTAARPGTPVCVVTLIYTAPLEEIDRQMKAHVAWLQQGFDADLLIICGRQVPRTGGIVVCRGHRADVERLVATDPLLVSGAATAEIVEFTASLAHPALADLLA